MRIRSLIEGVVIGYVLLTIITLYISDTFQVNYKVAFAYGIASLQVVAFSLMVLVARLNKSRDFIAEVLLGVSLTVAALLLIDNLFIHAL